MSFSERTVNAIRLAMEAGRISQRELARRIGVSDCRVSQMLSPKSNMTLRTVDRILAAIEGD